MFIQLSKVVDILIYPVTGSYWIKLPFT